MHGMCRKICDSMALQWLSLLVPLGVLTDERLAQVLAGQAPA